MAHNSAALGPLEAIRLAASRAVDAASRRVRFTVVLSLALIAGSFASAALIQMRLDRAHALDQAAYFQSVRARQIATDLSTTLERYAALGVAFANAQGAESSAALAEAGGPALRNLAILDRDGTLQSQMKRAPTEFLPLTMAALAAANAGRMVLPSRDAKHMTIVFRAGDRLIAVQLNTDALLPGASMEGAVAATRDGRILVLGTGWTEIPSFDTLSLAGAAETRNVEFSDGNRLVALAPVPGWPATAGASIATGEALGAWYGALPLYLFFILGPGIAGAGLAVIFVREFERRARAAKVVKNLRATRPGEAKLLIRLADAERRAAEAERSKAEFIAHMSHELRTPLNAVIGFSEVIERGIFGAPGHPKYVEYARDIGNAGRNLHHKIGDILEFANVEAGKEHIVTEAVDIADAARAAIDRIAGRAFSRRIHLTVSVPDTAMAIADGRAVKRILGNLLDNALDYTAPGGQIRVQVKNEEAAVSVSIRDDGFGFTQAELEKAGKAFARFDRPGAVTGAGLGLAISMALARRIDGALLLNGGAGGACAELRLTKA
ncbi:MAG: hypothetical protein GC166_00095 [Alphaproteobacteria bacterium]|nr:hypothetical protein [Alphaproteobacteria bacterium]